MYCDSDRLLYHSHSADAMCRPCFLLLPCLPATAHHAHFPYTNFASHVHQHVEQWTDQSSSPLSLTFASQQHLLSVKMHCPQAFLNLDFNCKLNVPEL